MERIREFLAKDRFAQHVGIELLEVGPGRAKARLRITDQHLNGVGIVHGAALFSLADLVFAAASNSHGTVAVAINAHIAFLKATTGGVLVAEGREVSQNPKLATYDVDIRNETGELVASFHGMVYRKKDPI